MSNVLAVALIVGLTLFFLLIRFVIHAAVNKTSDAIRNGYVRRQQQAAPPSRERLADRYAAPVSYDGVRR